MPESKAKVKKARWTPMQTAFVLHFVGDATAAAKAAGSKRPMETGCEMLKRPHIAEAIAAKRAAMIQESGKRLGKAVNISRNEIINGLADLARGAESEGAQVAAYGHLISIFGLAAKNDKDTDMFAGWSKEELDEYARTGAFPEWFGSGEVSSASTAPSGQNTAK